LGEAAKSLIQAHGLSPFSAANAEIKGATMKIGIEAKPQGNAKKDTARRNGKVVAMCVVTGRTKIGAFAVPAMQASRKSAIARGGMPCTR
jgi:hypothetical protein